MDNTLPHYDTIGNLYAVYALIDPRNYVIRYIGITNDVYARFFQHLRCDGTNLAKDVWIAELKAENVMLIMKTLEVVEDVEMARERETFWIHHYRFLGVSLFNQSIPSIQMPKRLVQPMLLRVRPASDYGRKNKDGKVKEIILYRLQHGTWPDGLSNDMQWYYNKHYIKRTGKYHRKLREWRAESSLEGV